MITQQSAFYLPSLFVGFVREGLQEFLVWFSNNGEYEQNKWLGSDVLEISRENVTQQADSDIVQYLPTDFTFNTEVEIPAPWSLNTWMFFFLISGILREVHKITIIRYIYMDGFLRHKKRTM